MVIYLDLVIAVNFAVDLLLLMCANRLTGYPSAVKRCAVGALVGGVYGGVCLCPMLSFLSRWYFSAAFLILICAVTFGGSVSALRRGAVFVLLSMTLGGVASGLKNTNIFVLVLAGTAILLLCRISVIDLLQGRRYVKVELSCKGRRYFLTALVDTGNTLKDPISGTQVLVVDPQIAWELFRISKKQLLNPVDTLVSTGIPGLRLIPYHGIGQANGMMLGVSADSVLINGRYAGRTIAFSPDDFGKDVCYQALTGGIS